MSNKKSPIIISVTGSKGGIGKTTVAVSVADALTRFHGQKVMLVETDAQASSSFHLGFRGMEAENEGTVPSLGLADLLRGNTNLEETLTKVKDDFYLLAGGPDAKLMITDHATNGRNNSGVKLFTKTIKDSDFDVCIIDSPPGIDAVTTFTWMSSDFVILPFQPNDVESIEALRTIMTHLEAARLETGVCPQIMGVVGSKVDKRTRMGREILNAMEEVYSKKNQYLGYCPIDVNMVNALALHIPIFEMAPASRSALHYKDIAAEVYARIKKAQREME